MNKPLSPQQIADTINWTRAEKGLPAINARVGLGGAIISDEAKPGADIHPEKLGERIIRAMARFGKPMTASAIASRVDRPAHAVETSLRFLIKAGSIDILIGDGVPRYFLKEGAA